MSGSPSPCSRQDRQAILHQLVVVWLVAGGAAKLRNAGARGEFDPDFRDEDAFEVEADDLHGKLPGDDFSAKGGILPNPRRKGRQPAVPVRAIA
jgi:hypothetical protein